jgi:hypothetical protein
MFLIIYAPLLQEAEEQNAPPPKYSTNHEIAYTVMDFLFASQVGFRGSSLGRV